MWSVLIIAGAIMGSFYLGDTLAERLYFISLTGMGMLTTVGVVVSMDTYGPVSDNAQGIAEMSGEFEGRPAEILGGLDAVGNSTKAIAKGWRSRPPCSPPPRCSGPSRRRSGSPASTCSRSTSPSPASSSGCLGGVGRVPVLLARDPRGRARRVQVVVEVRNQFRDHPGIMDFAEKPDYERVVDICTRTSLRELTTPGLLAVLAPVIAGFFLGAVALGAFLAGAILTGQLLAVMLSNSGGAWDNAKKYIEEGHYGGKGSEPHKAAVIGDTVGDPFKDTAGPALNPLIKVMNLVALLIAPLVVTHTDDTAIRVAVVAISAVVLGAMIWVSKSRKSELGPEIRRVDAASASTTT